MKSEKLQSKTKKNRVLLTLVLGITFLHFHFASAQVAYEGTPIPFIHSRDEWLSTPELQNLFSWHPELNKPAGSVPDYTPINQIILHDTGCNPSRAGCNDESIPTTTAIQNMFRFHAVTRGWGDIGYHFIIDRKGEIWEGRYGGAGVRGAHLYNSKTCQNFNVGSIGITLLGNYFDAEIPGAMMESLNRLIAWLSMVHNLNLDSTEVTIPIWTNEKDANGKCVFKKMENGVKNENGESEIKEIDAGGFTTSFVGPAVLTHRDIEPANSDIRNVNPRVLRQNALALVPEIQSFAYRVGSDAQTYRIAKGAIEAETIPGEKIVSVTKKQLDYFKRELFARSQKPEQLAATPTPSPSPVATKSFDEGALLKARGREEVYVLKDSKRDHITAASLFDGLGFRWEDIKEEDAMVINVIPLGSSITFPDGVLIKTETPDVYFLQESKRYLISSPDLFNAYQFNWSDLALIPLAEIDRYPWGGYVKWPNGAILQNQFNQNELVKVNDSILEPLKIKPPKDARIHIVNGRELASYQTAQVINPLVKLSLAEAFEKVKVIFGVAPKTALTPPTSASTVPLSVPPDQTSTPGQTKSPLVSQPTIRIALCKNRNIENCAFNVNDTLSIKNNGEGGVVVEGYEDHPGFATQLNDNAFRGKVTLAPSQEAGNVWLVNELPLEDYLKGVAETLGEDNPEYRKGLITMARTYAYYYLTQDKKYPDKPFDLTNTSFDQLYRGYNYEKRSNGLPALVEATKGQIISYQGKPIVAAYSSDSGGINKDACSMWIRYCAIDNKLKPEFQYLQGGIADPEGTLHDPTKVKASHGVGVSTTGARRLIELGKPYQEMLTYYYPGVAIEKIY